MARYKLIAMCNAIEGRDADLNKWYDGTHLPDMLKIPGFISGQRFRSFPGSPYNYVAIYEIETNDLPAAMAEIGKRAGTAQMRISDAIDGANAQMVFCQPYQTS